MDKDYVRGVKFGLGVVSVIFILSLLLFGFVYAIEFHPASEIVSGTFNGNYSFMNGNIGIGTSNPTSTLEINGSINVTGNSYGIIPAGAKINFNLSSCPIGWTQYDSNLTDIIPTMTGSSTPSGTVTSSGVYTTYYDWQAFDKAVVDNTGDRWVVSGSTGWIAYEFTEQKKILSYEITSSASLLQSPLDWTFDGWNGTSWIQLDSQTGVSSWSAYEERSYSISNSNYYIKYRLNVLNHFGDSFVSVAELKMYELDLNCIKD